MSIKSSFPTDSPSLVLDFANSRRLDPRITFTRAQTGNVASYVGPDGLVKFAGPNAPRFDHRYVARTNLITYSEDFGTAWSSGTVTVTTNQIANPLDGVVTADKYVATTDLDRHRVQQSIGNEIGIEYTGSLYVKSAGVDTVSLRIGRSSDADAVVFNILSGTVISEGSSITSSSIENVGNGWFRIIITNTPAIAGTQYFVISEDEKTSEFSGDGVNGFYFWGAQLEKNDTATAYIPTTSVPATESYMESLGLLIEESRANLLTHSNDFGSSAWTKQNGHPYVSNDAISPDGTVNATRIYRATSDQYLLSNPNNTAGTFTLSAWVRSENATGQFVMQSYTSTDHGQSTTFTATDQWERFSITVTVTVASNFYPCIPLNLNENFYIYGAQVEQGNFSTSYIPTSGSAVTRNSDKAGILGDNFSSFYNKTEGTFQIETSSSYGPQSGFPRLFFVGDVTNNQNNCIQYYYSNSNTQFGYSIWQGGSNRWIATSSISDVQSNNVVISYDSEGNANVTDDGVKLNYTNPTSPYVLSTTLDRVWIGSISANTGSTVPQAHFSRVSYYPLRLSNAQLQTLTS